MKIEWLVSDVTAVASLDRAERAMYFEGDFDWVCCWPIQVIFVVGEPLCDVGTPS